VEFPSTLLSSGCNLYFLDSPRVTTAGAAYIEYQKTATTNKKGASETQEKFIEGDR